MNNAALRMTRPVWYSGRDDGGMFPTELSVHEDPDDVPLRFLAVVRGGWGGGRQARRASLDEAREYAETMYGEGSE